VAVGAHELALGDLLQDAPAVVLAAEIGYGGELQRAGQMVPLHRGRVISLATVSARLPVLQREIPLDELGVPRALLLDPHQLRGLVIFRVVTASAVLAPRLVAAPATVEELN
jgi:hypothetical protein